MSVGDEAEASVLQIVVELARGLDVLELELKHWARINTAHGRETIGDTLARLRMLVQLQDTLLPAAIAGQVGNPNARLPKWVVDCWAEDRQGSLDAEIANGGGRE